MNLNDFVVLPSKPKSVKLNARNVRELRMETVHLDQENKDMENRLQELREIMRREKEEREKSGALRWKSAQASSGPRSKENRVKLSAGKMKIRVLKEDSLPETRKPPEKVPGPQPVDQTPGSSRKPRLKGKLCGQCEAKTAGLVCAECGEDYCVGCFARFHQKGALKHHRMISIQAELQTTVSSLDVLSRFQKQIGEERETPSQSTTSKVISPAVWRTHPAGEPACDTQTQKAQVLFVNEGDEIEDDEEDEGSLLNGCFDEVESSRSFQQALNEWRQGKQAEERRVPVTMEVMGTQAEESIQQPIHIEFREHGLSYMEKLLLKKHRRTPIESYYPYPALSSPPDSPTPSPTQPAEERHELTGQWSSSANPSITVLQ
uniref:Zinc finger B-box domain containing n=1 Tax=Astyanax mexicanus TaxID=7994 RepID=A0A3B1IPW4_ASTMX